MEYIDVVSKTNLYKEKAENEAAQCEKEGAE